MPAATIITSIASLGLDPNANDEQRDLALRLVGDRDLMESKGIHGHTAVAVEACIEEMAEDVHRLNDPLGFLLPDVEIVEPD